MDVKPGSDLVLLVPLVSLVVKNSLTTKTTKDTKNPPAVESNSSKNFRKSRFTSVLYGVDYKPSKTLIQPIPKQLDRIAKLVVDAAFTVHSKLGSGLLENVYEACHACEIVKRGLIVRRQVAFPVCYDGHKLDLGFRIDLLVEGCLVVEVKAVDVIHPVHIAQMLTYLKLTDNRLV